MSGKLSGAARSARKSVQGWRDLLSLPNWLVGGINLGCVALGYQLVTMTDGPVAALGVGLAALGGVGILDAVLGRVVE